MKINKTYKFRLYPTEEQRDILARWFGSVRFVYNHFLNERRAQYQETGKSDDYFSQCKALTELKNKDEYDWLYDVNSQTLQVGLKNLESAYTGFFTKKTGFPKFHKKGSKQSFEILQSLRLIGNRFYMPKFKNGIYCKVSRPLEGKICQATISKYPSGKYFVNIVTEQDIEVKKNDERKK